MKKLMSLMFVAGLSLTGLVACGGNEAKNPETSKPVSGGETDKVGNATTEKVEIKLWLDDDKYAEALIPAIEAAIPNIKIVYENVGSASTRTKLELDGPAGVGADVFIQPHDNMAPSIEGNILLPIGADLVSMIEDRMLEGSVSTVKTVDNYYGVPLSTESLALFYNKTLLADNELTLATTFEEIMEQAKSYNDVSKNKFIFRFEPGNAYNNHMFLTAAGFELYGPDHTDASQVNFNTPAVVSGLESFASLKEILDVPYA
ncbi:MAG: extracellular solute-binding protein, partial [Turicibacter sp.]